MKRYFRNKKYQYATYGIRDIFVLLSSDSVPFTYK